MNLKSCLLAGVVVGALVPPASAQFFTAPTYDPNAAAAMWAHAAQSRGAAAKAVLDREPAGNCKTQVQRMLDRGDTLDGTGVEEQFTLCRQQAEQRREEARRQAESQRLQAEALRQQAIAEAEAQERARQQAITDAQARAAHQQRVESAKNELRHCVDWGIAHLDDHSSPANVIADGVVEHCRDDVEALASLDPDNSGQCGTLCSEATVESVKRMLLARVLEHRVGIQ